MTYKFNDYYNPTNTFQIEFVTELKSESNSINQFITIKYLSEDKTILFEGKINNESISNKLIPKYLSITTVYSNFKIPTECFIDHKEEHTIVYHTKYSLENSICITFIESYKCYFYQYSITINKDSTTFKFHKMMSEDEKLYIHYVLQLKNNKWYNGKTKIENFWMRMSDHKKMTDRSNKFVTTNGFSSIDSITFGNSHEENSIHLRYCYLYGIDNVRGAAFTNEKITSSQTGFIKHMIGSTYDMCFICKEKGHYSNTCPLNNKISGTKRKREEDSEKISEPVSKKSKIDT